MEHQNGSVNVRENWQIEVAGKIYEAEFSELEQWIDEGSLQRTDKVRRGNLRWIEAGKVPKLVSFFNRGESGNKSAIKINHVDAALQNQRLTIETNDLINHSAVSSSEQFSSPESRLRQSSNQIAEIKTETSQSNSCCFHPEKSSVYLCETCGNGFCKTCPKSYGATVRICPCCGVMCKTVEETRKAETVQKQFENDLQKGFGITDFGKSLIYPFKFKASFIFGAIFFIFFSLGQSASAFGGGIMMFAALFCLLGTNMFGFGILSNTLENFSHGKTDADFMPSFETFSMWDDVLHPFILSIGVYIVSFGLFAAILLGGMWYAFNQISTAANAEAMQSAARINALKRQAQTAEVSPNETMTAESLEKSHDADNEKNQKLLDQAQKNNALSTEEDSAVTAAPSGDVFQTIKNFAAPFAIALLISLGWGIFYFPVACAVAGYTRSFAAVMSLPVGLDTIKRLGSDYFKVLAMVFALALIGGSFSLLAQTMLKPFDMPLLGNIPVKIISGALTYYFSIVFACILGFALYKNSNKLSLKIVEKTT